MVLPGLLTCSLKRLYVSILCHVPSGYISESATPATLLAALLTVQSWENCIGEKHSIWSPNLRCHGCGE